MRFEKIKLPDYGETMVVRKFLLFPYTLKDVDGRLSTRWLETCEITQEYGYINYGSGWVDQHWND